MSEPENPYRAPDSELREEIGDSGGTIENTLAGDADLDMQEVMSEAWECVRGIKGIVVVAIIAMIALSMVAGIVDTMVSESSFIAQILVNLLIYPIYAGLFMVCLRQSLTLSVDFAIPFSYYFCQRESIETLIYLNEVRGIRTLSSLVGEFSGLCQHAAAF